MVDIISPELRSAVMSRIRGKDTTPERYLASLLRAAGLRFKRHDKTLPGCPDFVFNNQRLALFVDGDFWHGWRFPIWRHRMPDFWRAKIAGNRARDRKTRRRLTRLGWRALRVWEHQIESHATACVARIARALGESAVDWQAVEARRQRMPLLKRRNRLPKP
jgi:DNA mismatch endonuclease (patch repair protein)